MVQGLSPDAVEAIRDPVSIDARIAGLKQLKGDIVGHDHRKELLVRQGLLRSLIALLSSTSRSSGKRSEARSRALASDWTQEDEVRLQAVQIITSVAGGGVAFLPPLVAGGAPEQLVDIVHPDTPPRLLTAALQGLRSVVSAARLSLAASSSLQGDAFDGRDRAVLRVIDENTAPAFEFILRRPCHDAATTQQLQLATDVLTACSFDTAVRHLLAAHGVLDALASLLASHSISSKHFDYHVNEHASALRFLHPPPASTIPGILKALAAIVLDSNFRILRFILCQPLQDLFLNSSPDNIHGATHLQQSGPLACVEPLLPKLHVPGSKSVSFGSSSRSLPALGNLRCADREAGVPGVRSLTGWYADHAVAVCGWLIFLARDLQWAGRCYALQLLALVNGAIASDSQPPPSQAEDMRRERDRKRQLTILAVPLAVSLVNIASETTVPHLSAKDGETVKELACDVLGRLVLGSKSLQTTAAEAGAIRRVCAILKKSFDSVPLAKPMWSARPPGIRLADQPLPETCQLGSRGLPPEVLFAMSCRRGALDAIASLTKREDTHRKAVVEAGGIKCIIESLKPFTPEVLAELDANKTQMTPKDGNTISVIMAACHAALSMSRSVSLLRTSLIDAGIALPTFNLLKHPNLDVQLAATDVCCNLLMEFSPMREDLINAGVIKSLAEHARQSEMRLRLSSLWALKHLLLQAPKEIKLQCLEELGAGWLVGAIHGEHGDVTIPLPANGGVSVGLSSSNSVGEQVNLLNPSSMDVDELPLKVDDGGDIQEDDDDDNDEDDDGEVLYDEQSSTHYQASQLRSTLSKPPAAFHSKKYLSSINNLETNPAVHARRCEIAVQEQALDFVRNFIHGDPAGGFLDHLLEEMGSIKLFTLLTDKLSPIKESSLAPAPRSVQANPGLFEPSSSSRVYQPTELILSSIHVLNHIANCSPRHKSLLIAQRPLLTAWLPHFSHPDRRVRMISVLTTSTLVWIEDGADRSAARARLKELHTVGIEDTVRGMTNDPDLDVRERLKTAFRMFDGL